MCALEYGRTQLTKTGRVVSVIADGDLSGAKGAGISLDLATITAVAGSPATLGDDTVVPVGAKYLRYGQVVTKITATALFGPYDPVVADGRQLLVRGECFFLNRTWVDQPGGLIMGVGWGTLHPPVFDKGLCWKERMLQSGVVAHTLALGPTLAEFEAAFPNVRWWEN